jgi:hypothetical protein
MVDGSTNAKQKFLSMLMKGDLMKTQTLIVGTLALLLVSGCATKRYPIATDLSAVEQRALTCRELAIELAKTDEVEAKITDTATTDWRSVAGFLGDYGIGNAMAKSEASAALSDRRMSIKAAQVNKGCSDAAIPPAEEVESSSQARADELVSRTQSD